MKISATGRLFVFFLSLLFAAASVNASARLGIASLQSASFDGRANTQTDYALALETEWAVCEMVPGGSDSGAPDTAFLDTTSLGLAGVETGPGAASTFTAALRGAHRQAPPATGPPSA